MHEPIITPSTFTNAEKASLKNLAFRIATIVDEYVSHEYARNETPYCVQSRFGKQVDEYIEKIDKVLTRAFAGVVKVVRVLPDMSEVGTEQEQMANKIIEVVGNALSTAGRTLLNGEHADFLEALECDIYNNFGNVPKRIAAVKDELCLEALRNGTLENMLLLETDSGAVQDLTARCLYYSMKVNPKFAACCIREDWRAALEGEEYPNSKEHDSGVYYDVSLTDCGSLVDNIDRVTSSGVFKNLPMPLYDYGDKLRSRIPNLDPYFDKKLLVVCPILYGDTYLGVNFSACDMHKSCASGTPRENAAASYHVYRDQKGLANDCARSLANLHRALNANPLEGDIEDGLGLA